MAVWLFAVALNLKGVMYACETTLIIITTLKCPLIVWGIATEIHTITIYSDHNTLNNFLEDLIESLNPATGYYINFFEHVHIFLPKI